ncbi:MAG: bifunctional riboflavin kinase/FAD synthetase [Anaerolineae bacterium]
MKVIRGAQSARLDRGTAITIGVFDGVHLGHRHLVKEVIAEARRRNLLAGVVTLDPHPLQILKPDVPLGLLASLEERLRHLDTLGLDFAVVHPFSPQTAITSAERFVCLLQRHLKMEALVVGPDFALGHQRQGDTAYLAELARGRGIGFRVVEPLLLDGEPVKSSRVRSLIAAGRVREAGRLLARPPTVEGHVRAKQSFAEGGHVLSLAVDRLLLLPADGVYAGEVEKSQPALIQIRGGAVEVGTIDPTRAGDSPAPGAGPLVVTAEDRLELEPLAAGDGWAEGWKTRLAPLRAQAGAGPA